MYINIIDRMDQAVYKVYLVFFPKKRISTLFCSHKIPKKLQYTVQFLMFNKENYPKIEVNFLVLRQLKKGEVF